MENIIIKKLYQSEDDSHWDYSELVERAIVEQAFGKDSIELVSGGYSPEWDVLLVNGKTIEIKVQSTRDICIEIAQKNKAGEIVPSGLSLSKADYWIILSAGSTWNRTISDWDTVGKLRLFDRSLLEDVIQRREPSTMGNQTVIKVKPKDPDVHDNWIGDVPVIFEELGKKIIGYKITQLKQESRWKTWLNDNYP